MNIINNPNTRKTGKISFAGREIILWSIDLPQCDSDDNILNVFFSLTAENYKKYLEAFAEKELVPKLKIMLENSKRSRDIRNELGIPLNASLSWNFFFFKEKYLSLKCETKMIFSNEKSAFTIKTLNLDTEKMILKKAKHFAKKAVAKKNNFYIQGSKLYTFDRNFAVCENSNSRSEDMIKKRTYKIDNIRPHNLCKARK